MSEARQEPEPCSLSELNDSTRSQLSQLWAGGPIPQLSPEEIDLSLKLWQKIKARKQRTEKQKI